MKELKYYNIGLVTFLLVLIFDCCSVTSSRNTAKKIKKLMDTYYNLGQFNGTVLVADSKNILFKNGYGLANKEWNIPNDIETRYRIGSVTKQFTAAIILRLVDDGKLDLDQKITDVLTGFRKDTGSKVSIHQLLCHTSGIAMPDLSIIEYDAFFQKKQTTKQLLEKLCSEDLAFEPGSQFRYSSAGYIVLGAIIEKLTSLTWEEALHLYILEPLEMNNTGVDDYEKILTKRASGYQTNYGLGNARFKYMPTSFSSGAMYSTVEDMHKWFEGLTSGKLLTPETRDLLFKKHSGKTPKFYGYGWFITEKEHRDSTINLVFHAGDVNGFSSMIYGNPETGQVVILLTNNEGTHYYDIAENIFKILDNLPAPKPERYIADILRESIYDHNIDSAMVKYVKITEEGIENYNTDEDELIELGYDLLFTDRISESIEVLKITTLLHPGSSRAFASLGEAFYLNNMNGSALHNYQKSLELNSDNIYAKEMIQLLLNNND